MRRRTFLAALSAGLARSQAPADPNAIFICPMDPDVRSHDPGACPRCGMKLASGLPEPAEYRLELTTTPRAIRPGQSTKLSFAVRDPWRDRPVTKFHVLHERLFHLFVVSQDLEFFLHEHPVFGPDGRFHLEAVFPQPGLYRILSDFYPDGGTPQLIAKTVIVPGPAPGPPRFTPGRRSANVAFRTVPERPIAGLNTQLHFHLADAAGLEPYLGAWGHLLVVSDDLVDMIHTHPFIADGGPDMQFNAVLPRPGHDYRLWMQYQRWGEVHTVRFDVPAFDLR
jgi:hypothetical protein